MVTRLFGIYISSLTSLATECLIETGQAQTHTTTANNEDNKYRQIMRLREVHLLAFFILIYVGTEVTLGGQLKCLHTPRKLPDPSVW